MKRLAAFALVLWTLSSVERVIADEKIDSKSIKTSVQNGWVTVVPPEFQGPINNPLKGFRDYKKNGYGLLKRQYIKWNEIEVGANDTVDRIIAHTNEVAQAEGKRFEELNIKLIPRVYLDWDGEISPGKDSKQYWPSDLHTFDYDSPEFQVRLKALIAKLGQAWDDDPRIFAVQMGLIGRWGEHHSPTPTQEQRRLLTEAFQKAFKNKPVLVRHADSEFMDAGYGIYYDTFANISREPHVGGLPRELIFLTHVRLTGVRKISSLGKPPTCFLTSGNVPPSRVKWNTTGRSNAKARIPRARSDVLRMKR